MIKEEKKVPGPVETAYEEGCLEAMEEEWSKTSKELFEKVASRETFTVRLLKKFVTCLGD